MTRRGAETVGEGNTASAEWRRAADRARRDTEAGHGASRPDTPPEVWVREDDIPALRRGARRADPAVSDRPAPRRRRSRTLPGAVAGELAEAGGRRAPKLARDLAAGADAYQAGRYRDAERLLRQVVQAAPSAPGARELFGLTLYRLGRWRAAKAELEAYHELTGSVDQYPVVADCERALGRHRAVDQIWEALRHASPPVEILTEGRLVAAGSLADRGRFTEAIGLLQRFEADRARPKEWQLRTWYALADLYERAGDVPRARALFQRVLSKDADFFDAAERLAALR